IEMAKRHGVPTLVDAAAERPDVPNHYIEAGCDLVTYSGGKCICGPNNTGLLIGRKDLVDAAVGGATPSASMGRSMKVGKECIMGLLAAVDLWVNVRDHDAEWKEWLRKLDYMSKKIKQVPTVKTEVVQPGRLSNYTPCMTVTWNQKTVKLTAAELSQKLLEGEPRVGVSTRKGDEFRSSGEWVSINPYMMETGEEVPAAQKFYDVMSNAI
ncbi:aminotransferase class V-fold PLP-dependent enzyme, partial [Candidatus Latescibacterota bacterium]